MVTPTSATPAAVPSLLPSVPSSILFATIGSVSSAATLAVFEKAPTASIVAITVMVTSLAGLPLAIFPIVHGKEVHPPPLTDVIVKFVGVSVTTTLFAVSGPTLETIIV